MLEAVLWENPTYGILGRAAGNVSHGGIRNPLHLSKEWMSETLLPTAARAPVLYPTGTAGPRSLWRPRDPLEGRGEQTNVSGDGNMDDAQKSENMSPQLARIAELSREDKQRKFFSIAHLLTIDALYAAFLSLRTEASAGVDGVTYKEYDVKTWEKIPILHEKLKSGEYRAQPVEANLYTERRWKAEAHLDSIPGGQDRPAGDGEATPRDL